mgnify:CR=1 FL=1
MLITSANRSSRDTFAIGAQNILEIGEAILWIPRSRSQPTLPVTSTLCPLPPPTSPSPATVSNRRRRLCPAIRQHHRELYHGLLPFPRSAGYIELVCMVPTTWQQIGVTYTPTFVSGKTLNLPSTPLT